MIQVEDRCVMCGATIPEGTQVCISCFKKNSITKCHDTNNTLTIKYSPYVQPSSKSNKT